LENQLAITGTLRMEKIKESKGKATYAKRRDREERENEAARGRRSVMRCEEGMRGKRGWKRRRRSKHQ